ncbi:MAG: acyl carrier protein [Lachnospiraceae bacterium]|nr:acyl carrier protein [Lachnospiraceae bacterium]
MEAIINILKGLHPEVNFETEKGLIDQRILDSFDIVTLVGELMDEFDVEIGAEHMVPENFNSAEAILNLVTRLEEE